MRSTFSNLVLSLALVLLRASCGFAENPVYDYAAKHQKAEVSVLAISSSIHQSSGNQEIYLADIHLNGTAHQMAKLVDVYPPMDMPIQRSVLIDRHVLRVTLTRNPECDATGQSFFLALGDSNIFDASTRSALNQQASEKIPCYNVLHGATRLAK